ncbi:MAG TPA: hypothetical protein VFE65_10520 [Pseudonocardia sp.]|nr:hypothetical protein [Pseudonocardia sp.]
MRTRVGLSWSGRRCPAAAPGPEVEARAGGSGRGRRAGEARPAPPVPAALTEVDDRAGTVAVEGTVVGVRRIGLTVQPHTKSKAGMRTVMAPVWVIELLRRRPGSSAGSGCPRRRPALSREPPAPPLPPLWTCSVRRKAVGNR